MRKSHTKGFTISLSGGADSAMVTYLCVMGIKLGIKELGYDLFVEKYCPHLNTNYDNSNELVSKLITTAYQATAQSGIVTTNAAYELATVLGTTHYNFNVEPMVYDYKRIGKIIKGTELTFEEDDLVLQNLQARVRAPSIWIIANFKGSLLLTTSNMSEAAVGYCSLDGDTAGGLAPIGGLPKQYIREFLVWAEKTGPIGYGVVPSLGLINNQQPTAELRPATANQTDETDLMPYQLLHKIETMVVKNRYTPVEIYKTLMNEEEYDNNQLIKNITKFFKLFSVNQWKRERLAISFHMDDHNLDPKTWCRVPILSGCYVEELEELQEYLV